MTAIQARIGGAWVNTTKVGKARIGGAWVDFAPAAGSESIAFGTLPTNTNETDGGSANYNMGIEFTVTTPKNCLGIRWRVPDAVSDPASGPHAIALWNISETRVAYKEFTPVPGGNQDILFDLPYAMAASSFTATVYTNHYVYRSGSPAGAASPSGNIVAVASRLQLHNGGAATAPYPGSTTGLNFYISPLVAV